MWELLLVITLRDTLQIWIKYFPFLYFFFVRLIVSLIVFVCSRILWGSMLFFSKAKGNTRGIWILSSCTDLTFNLVDSNNQVITLSINKGNATCSCFFANALTIPVTKSLFWDHLNYVCVLHLVNAWFAPNEMGKKGRKKKRNVLLK